MHSVYKRRIQQTINTSDNILYSMSCSTFTYTADENGAEVSNHGPAEMPAYVAKRLNGSKNRFKKKGTPAEREAAVEARRQAVLTEKKNKARKYIDKVEAYGKIAAAAAVEENNFGEKMQENTEFSEKCEQWAFCIKE